MKKLIFVAVTLLLSACASKQFAEIARSLASSNDPTAQTLGNFMQGAREVGEEEEIVVGNSITGGILGASPLVQNSHLQSYVNDLGMWLAMHSERPDLPWRFGVTETMDYNAFSMPGGVILISKGVFKRCKSESELANILSHEIAHVLKRHHIHAIQQESKSGAYKGLGNLAAKELKTDAAIREVASLAVGAGADLYSRGLDKNDEFEADAMGVVIASRAGFDPRSLLYVLEDLHSESGESSQFSLLFKTHPAPAERYKKLNTLMGKKLARFSRDKPSSERFKEVVSSL